MLRSITSPPAARLPGLFKYGNMGCKVPDGEGCIGGVICLMHGFPRCDDIQERFPGGGCFELLLFLPQGDRNLHRFPWKKAEVSVFEYSGT